MAKIHSLDDLMKLIPYEDKDVLMGQLILKLKDGSEGHAQQIGKQLMVRGSDGSIKNANKVVSARVETTKSTPQKQPTIPKDQDFTIEIPDKTE